MGVMHHLDVGCADASIITSASHTFLVDCEGVGRYAHLLPDGKRLRGVFITHQHRDHFSGLQYLRDKGFQIDFLIYSPYERRRGDNSVTLDEWDEFEAHRDHFVKRGTEVRAPYRQDIAGDPWWGADTGVSFWMLGPHKHIAEREKRELHDASLVVKAQLGARSCLFTGDASDALLAEVARTTTNYCGDILHASHHGSMNGAEETFLKGCAAKYTVISTAEGVHENVPHPDALKLYDKYTKEIVYRTDAGSIEWKF